jgi:tripartite-type tricarboxylate transporter receptor subunit TctC
VTPSLPATTIPELIAYAKANPGKVNMGSGGIGSGNQLAGELFKTMAGIDLVHVPYRGAGPATVDLMGGQVQVMFNTMSASLQYVRAGKLRALGVATKTRQRALPDLPTVAEFVPGFEASFWTGIAGPKGIPPEIVDKINKAVNASLADPAVKARLAEWGATALGGSPADFPSSSPMRPRSGARSFAPPTSRRSDADRLTPNIPRHPLGENSLHDGM